MLLAKIIKLKKMIKIITKMNMNQDDDQIKNNDKNRD